MGRPLKEGLDYFPHDTDAVNDEKIETMRALFGAEGYAFFFISLERIFRTKNGQLDISTMEKRASLSAKIGVDDERFMEILEAAFSIDLFDRKAFDSKGLLTSRGVKRRVKQVNEERGRKRAWKSKKLSTAKTPDSSGVLDGENCGTSTQRKEKKRKEKKSKEKGVWGETPAASPLPPTRCTPPTVEQVSAYCGEKGYHIDPEAFVDFYTANGWKQSKGKPIVDWQAAVRTWERRLKADGKIPEEDPYAGAV